MTTPEIPVRAPPPAPTPPVEPEKVVERTAPKATVPHEEEVVRVYVWDVVVRVTHWVIALSIGVLAVTGIYIGSPYIVVPGEAKFHFVMGTMKTVHFYAAIAFTLAVLSRIFWMFVGGHNASWRTFIPTTRKRWRDFFGTLAFYTFLREKSPPTQRHNPVAGLAYTAVFFLYLVMIVSGLGLYGTDVGTASFMHAFEPLTAIFGGAQTARWFHHVAMWLLIGFFVHHLYSAILMSVKERNGTLDSIFSGRKWVKRKDID